MSLSSNIKESTFISAKKNSFVIDEREREKLLAME
jgi:hypothetical protein